MMPFVTPPFTIKRTAGFSIMVRLDLPVQHGFLNLGEDRSYFGQGQP
jgi:hypothetical protein